MVLDIQILPPPPKKYVYIYMGVYITKVFHSPRHLLDCRKQRWTSSLPPRAHLHSWEGMGTSSGISYESQVHSFAVIQVLNYLVCFFPLSLFNILTQFHMDKQVSSSG